MYRKYCKRPDFKTYLLSKHNANTVNYYNILGDNEIAGVYLLKLQIDNLCRPPRYISYMHRDVLQIDEQLLVDYIIYMADPTIIF